MNPKALVAAGYDAVADRFADWKTGVVGDAREEWIADLLSRLPASPHVLELGCGGEPTGAFADQGRLTGVDLSAEQLRRASERVPQATFLHADASTVTFAPASFDAVVALFVLGHVPRTEIEGLLARIAGWLRPGGWFLATMGARGLGEAVEEDWLGVPMFFSSLHEDESRALVRRAGMALVRDEVVVQTEPGHGEIAFLWVLARRAA